MELSPYVVCFLCGVALSALYFFRSNKADRLNRDLVREEIQKMKAEAKELKLTLDSVHAWVKLLDAERSKVHTVQITDRLNCLEKEIMETRDHNSKMVMRLLSSYRPIERKAEREVRA